MNRIAVLLFLPSLLGASAALAQIPATVTTERVIYQTLSGDSSGRRTDTVFVRTTLTSRGLRSDYTGSTNSNLPMLHFGSIEIIEYADSDVAVTYLDPVGKTYFAMHPLQLMAQNRKMLGALGVSSQVVPATSAVSIDSIGAGDIIDGYKTVHFRTHMTVRMGFGSLPGLDTIVTKVTTDLYIAPDFKSDSLLAGSVPPALKKMGSTFAGGLMPGMQEMMDQMAPLYKRIAKSGRPVRTVIATDAGAAAGADKFPLGNVMDTELVKVESTTVSPQIFAIPADYKKSDPLAAMMAKSDSLLKTLQSLHTPF